MRIHEDFHGLADRDDLTTSRLRALVAALLALLDAEDPEREVASRCCAAALRAWGRRERREAGWRRHRWSHSCRGPGMRRTRLRGHSDPPASAWWDHAYRQRRPGQTEQWVSEPYVLEVDALRELVALADDGWEVTIDGESLHFPGSTVRVVVHRNAR